MKQIVKILIYGALIIGVTWLLMQWDTEPWLAFLMGLGAAFVSYMLGAAGDFTDHKDDQSKKELYAVAEKFTKEMPNITVLWMGRQNQWMVSCEYTDDHSAIAYHTDLACAIIDCYSSYKYHSELHNYDEDDVPPADSNHKDPFKSRYNAMD